MKRVLAGTVLLTAAALTGFDSPTVSEDELPTNIAEAEVWMIDAALYFAGEAPDEVTCIADVDIGDGHRYFECTVTKAGHEPVLGFVRARHSS